MSSRHDRVTTVANLVERRDRAPHPVLPGTVPLGDGARRQPSWRLPARRARSAHGKAGGPWRYSRYRFVTLAQVETLERLVEGDGSVGIMTSALRVAERTSSCRSAMRVTTYER